MIKEVTIYCNGDSNDIKTWSNVPYLFCKTLEGKGIKVNRVNIHANKKFLKYFNSFFFLLFRRIFKCNNSPTLYRTILHRTIINRRLKQAEKAYPNSQFNIFLSYLFLNKYSHKPNILWCDWSDRMVLKRSEREPSWFEKRALKAEDEVIKKAEIVYTMFPVCKKKMETLYNREFRYLGINVVNSLYKDDFDINTIIHNRYNSNKIVFIGGINYKNACEELVKAFILVKKQNPLIELDIIGLNLSQLNINTNEGITCHGYLDKSIETQRKKYYQILLNSKVLVQPAKKWGAYSSCIEAMYFGCPLIVRPYEDFVEDFGKDINFGYYLLEQNSLPSKIDKIFSLEEKNYSNLCYNAHESVKDYTWDNYIDLLLKDIQNQLTES